MRYDATNKNSGQTKDYAIFNKLTMYYAKRNLLDLTNDEKVIIRDFNNYNTNNNVSLTTDDFRRFRNKSKLKGNPWRTIFLSFLNKEIKRY